MEGELALRGGGVDSFGEGYEVGPEVLKLVHLLYEVLQGAPNRSSLHTTSIPPARRLFMHFSSSGRI